MPTREQLVLLAQTANFIEDLPHDKFHMPGWSSFNATEYSCGTAGCFAGWAATLHIKRGWSFLWGVPSYGHEVGAQAIADFFGITATEATWLSTHLGGMNRSALCEGMLTYLQEHGLSREKDITPRHAAKRARDIIRLYDPSVLDEDVGKAQLPEPCAAGATA